MTRQFLWERFTSGEELTEAFERSGGTLAALRRAANSAPGESPALWPHYTTLEEDGRITTRLRAEHACLTIYGVHQQGNSLPVHAPKISLGQALRQLKNFPKFSSDAVDARVARFATATRLEDMAYHLRALVGLMKSCTPTIRFDYTQLYRDFCGVQDERTIGRVRRRWGSAYHFEQKETTVKEK